MMWTIIVQRRAEIELGAAADWYEKQSSGLGEEFVNRFRATVARIADNPLQYQIIEDGLRRAQVKRSPYGILYVVAGEDVIITSCFHGQRHRRHWR